MLGFVISTLAFSVAVFALNHYLTQQQLHGTGLSKAFVLVVATAVSIGAGWVVDKLDGDADLPQNRMAMTDVIQSGDPIQIAKMLVGMH